jgi:ubiquinone biosynthesis protein
LINFRKVAGITKTYRHIGRYQEILGVFFKYGFGDLLKVMKVGPYLDLGLNLIGKENYQDDMARPERLRKACEALGPTFIKLGQLLSTRPELLSDEYAKALSKLQDQVQGFPFDQVKAIVSEEMGQSIDEVFKSINPKPLAAASIAQVHRATLLDGTEVVLKVQRPRITQRIAIDVEILNYLARMLEDHFEEARFIRPTKLVENFGQNLSRELDYEIEVKNLELFSNAFEKDSDIRVPQVYRSYCSPRLIVMEYIEGQRLSDLLKQPCDKAQLDQKKVAANGARLLMLQVFRHGFYHADPHPGNLLFLPGHVICFLDFGMIGRIGLRDRQNLADLAYAIVGKRERKAVTALLKLTHHTTNYDRQKLEMDVREILDHVMGRPLKDISVRLVMMDLIQLLKKHEMSIKTPYIMLLRAVVSMESMGRQLDPEFNIGDHMKPFLRSMLMERYHPSHLKDVFLSSTEDLIEIFQEWPNEIQQLMKKANSGQLSLDFHHQGLLPLTQTLVRVANRLAFAIILSSLIIGSSLIIHAELPPKWHGVPIVGLSGFCMAGVIAFFLMIAMLRRSKDHLD